MLMDLFFDSLDISRKRRVHFNKFMLDVHQQTFRLKQSHPRGIDLIPEIAYNIHLDSYILCFDEFQVLIYDLIFHVSVGHRYS